jgi:hypothetical protein
MDEKARHIYRRFGSTGINPARRARSCAACAAGYALRALRRSGGICSRHTPNRRRTDWRPPVPHRPRRRQTPPSTPRSLSYQMQTCALGRHQASTVAQTSVCALLFGSSLQPAPGRNTAASATQTKVCATTAESSPMFARSISAGPFPIFGTLNYPRLGRVPFNVRSNPLKFGGSADPMIERFILPEELSRPSKDLVRRAGRAALDRLGDRRKFNAWFQQHMNVIWHHNVSVNLAQPKRIGVLQSFNN